MHLNMKYSLPEAANDLLIKDGKLLMRSLAIYEVLRRFRHLLNLTPFRFEDFSAALLSEEQSPLTAEIHIQLLKALVREDRQQQTWLGPPDIRDSVNIYLHLADHTTWPSALRIYLSADKYGNLTLLDKLSGDTHKNYPFKAGIETKLEVLEQLCDQFLLSNLAREAITSSGSVTDKHETICRSCSKGNADLVPCITCSAVYHSKCIDSTAENNPNAHKEKGYACSLCRSNFINGVSDCEDMNETSNLLLRHEPIGVDKIFRRYFFLVRRLFIVDETEDDVRYYSSPDQLQDVLDTVKSSMHDKQLLSNLNEHRETIEQQMKLTNELYETLLKDNKNEDGSYSMSLGEEGSHKNYINHYNSHCSSSTVKQYDRDVNRSLNNKFCMTNASSFKWHGAIDGHLTALSTTVKASLLKFESSLPQPFEHTCWQSHRSRWCKSINTDQSPENYAIALSKLETGIKPVFFKSSWNDSIGFQLLFRSTFLEREELKKTDRQPRGFERREWFYQDFELSQKFGTMVKFSSKLKPVKHQIWKQKGEEYRLTGLNGWYWQSCCFRSRNPTKKISVNSARLSSICDKLIASKEESKTGEAQPKKIPLAIARLPPCHDFKSKRSKILSILILPELELRRLSRSGGLREIKGFSYTAKQNHYVWPYGMTPRPTFRTCWLYRNRVIDTMQDVALQLKVLNACLRWDDLQVRIPASGVNTIVTDDATITIELLKKRERLPYLLHSEYLIKKVKTPIEQPTKYRKVGIKKSTPSARSGLRARRQIDEDEEKGPKVEEIWVPEEQLELWELKLFNEKLERQRQLSRERALREEAQRRRKLEEEKRRKLAEERKRRQDEEAARKNNSNSNPVKQNILIANTSVGQVRPQASTPVLRYFRTEQGQIIRLPASYLQRGTPLILRHVGPGPNQTNTYIIRPQITPVTTSIAPNSTIRPTTNGTLIANSTAQTSNSTVPAIAATIPTPAKSEHSTEPSNIVSTASLSNSVGSTDSVITTTAASVKCETGVSDGTGTVQMVDSVSELKKESEPPSSLAATLNSIE